VAVVVVARGAAIAAVVVSRVVDEDVAVSQSVRANFPCSLCLVVLRDSELWKCGRANAPGDRQRANVAADESGAMSTKKVTKLCKLDNSLPVLPDRGCTSLAMNENE